MGACQRLSVPAAHANGRRPAKGTLDFCIFRPRLHSSPASCRNGQASLPRAAATGGPRRLTSLAGPGGSTPSAQFALARSSGFQVRQARVRGAGSPSSRPAFCFCELGRCPTAIAGRGSGARWARRRRRRAAAVAARRRCLTTAAVMGSSSRGRRARSRRRPRQPQQRLQQGKSPSCRAQVRGGKGLHPPLPPPGSAHQHGVQAFLLRSLPCCRRGHPHVPTVQQRGHQGAQLMMTLDIDG